VGSSEEKETPLVSPEFWEGTDRGTLENLSDGLKGLGYPKRFSDRNLSPS